MIVTRAGLSAQGQDDADLALSSATIVWGSECFTRVPEKYLRSAEAEAEAAPHTATMTVEPQA